jgi:hypothetical protein
LKVPVSTLGNRLMKGPIPTSLGRFKATFSNEEVKELAVYCRAVEAKFYGLTIRMIKALAFEYAERNGIDNRFNKEKTAAKDWVISFCKRQNLTVRLTEKNIAFAELQGLTKFK